jgi:hypothetical protein
MDKSATKEEAAGGAISERISDPPQHPLGGVEEWTGRPLKIAVQDGARWFKCPTSAQVGQRLLVYDWPRPTIPSLMPRLLEGSAKRGRRGRPPLSESDRRRVLFTAWAVDVARAGQRQLARSLHTDATRALDVEEWARSQVRRALAAGRAAYRELGVLPWGVCDDEELRGAWWGETFREGVRQWQLEAIAEPTDEPQPDPESARQEQHAELHKQLGRLTAPLTDVLRASFPIPALNLNLPPANELRDGMLRSHGVEPWSLE